MDKPILEITDLHAGIGGRQILKGFTLKVNAGEVHAIMGPNGSGKSTLSKAVSGEPHIEIAKGDILYKGESLLKLEPEERALKGIFMAFQYPVEIPGVNNASFLRMAYNARRKNAGLKEADPLEFHELLAEKLKAVDMPEDFLKRSLNHGFSGGEKKRNEMLQMAVLEPELAILDETDSGLDIDALREIAASINRMRSPKRAMIIITHYQRLLDYVKPDKVHILEAGRIARSGGPELALELEKKGYAGFNGK